MQGNPVRLYASTCVLLLMLLVGIASAQDDATTIQDANPAAAEVGQPAPNFTAATETEELVELKDYLAANDHVVLVFVRAHW